MDSDNDIIKYNYYNLDNEIRTLNQLVVALLTKRMPPLTYYGYPFGFLWTSLFLFTGTRSQMLFLYRAARAKKLNNIKPFMTSKRTE